MNLEPADEPDERSWRSPFMLVGVAAAVFVLQSIPLTGLVPMFFGAVMQPSASEGASLSADAGGPPVTGRSG